MKQFNINNIVRENVKGLQPYSSARDEYISDGSNMVFLDANENPFENGVNRYPDPQQRKLKTALSKLKEIAKENIILGNGSDEILDLIFRAFCEPKEDNIITLPPTYGMYKVLAGINAVENREVLLTKRFELDVDAILKSVNKKTKIIFLCSPNNPTGNSFSDTSISRLLENFNGLVVIDEAYIDFSHQKSWIGRLKICPNLIVTQTLSKAYGMAGIRLGICYASSEIISVLNKIKPPYNINVLTKQRALFRIENINTVKSEVDTLVYERVRLMSELLQFNFIKEIYPSDANFILVRVDDADKRYKQLLGQGIVVRNRSSQPLCNNTLRLTVGTIEENEKLIKSFLSISKS